MNKARLRDFQAVSHMQNHNCRDWLNNAFKSSYKNFKYSSISNKGKIVSNLDIVRPIYSPLYL